MSIFSRIFLPFLLLGYIAVETYLKLHNTSLCGQVGCKLAGELLRFDPIYLNYFGLASLLVLILLGYLSLKSSFFKMLFFIGLYSAIAFEATIISYQFVVNPEPCIFCLGIFSSLLVIALFADFKRFAITLATVSAIFVGMQTLAVTKNHAFITQDGYYLIQSDTCPHCKKVKAYLLKHNIDYHAISTQEASARSFLKFINITTIPVLIIKKPFDTRILTGDANIIAYFQSQNTYIEASTPSLLETTSYHAELFSAVPDDGCTITITQAPACEDDNVTQP
ncbi:MAG: glutaredoxin [Sulfurovum sp.]|nr:glutaredoxin [Sulfurovum sp.]